LEEGYERRKDKKRKDKRKMDKKVCGEAAEYGPDGWS